MQSVMILGRQPSLGMAELESLYGADKLQPLSDGRAVVVDVDPCLLAFDRLGGSVKFCKLLTIQDTTDWGKIEKFLLDVSPGHAATMPEGKMRLGLSVIGLNVNTRRLEATGLKMKKAIRVGGRNVRLVPNQELELNSAQVVHNQLTGPTGWELYFLRDGDKTYVAQTVKVQDIDSYTRRDRERPKRDTRVGMLPPKLAQILINLASGPLSEAKLQNICEIPAGEAIPRTILGQTVLDPFCGTGVVLQEALLMGYDVAGSDLEPRMVQYSQANLEWLGDFTPDQYHVEVGDATNHRWNRPINLVASEVYLGRPFTSPPSPEILAQTVAECNLIIKKFLRNIHDQLEPGTRLCLAVPAWQTGRNQFKYLPLIDQISDLGYNALSFEHVSAEDLLYYREDQIVARELIVITKE
jgi:tRNA (guanine10-N2)-dimethyltransferase